MTDAETIRKDNDQKEYFLSMLLEMCVKAGVDVSHFELEKGPAGDIVAVVICRYFSKTNDRINVEGDAPLTMVKELIIKGHLG